MRNLVSLKVMFGRWYLLTATFGNFMGISYGIECKTRSITDQFTKKTQNTIYRCSRDEYCCSSGCCQKFYSGWYIWVPLTLMVFSCCLLSVLRFCKSKPYRNKVHLNTRQTKDSNPSQWRQQETSVVFADTQCTHEQQVYSCKNYQTCCDGFCCDEFYAIWYIWVLFFAFIFLCVVAMVMVRKKKQQKNRITHSMFLDRLRERIEQQIIDEVSQTTVAQQRNSSNQELLSTFDEPYVLYNSNNQSVGIGGASTPHRLTPNRNPGRLFQVTAPPPYSETVGGGQRRNNLSDRNEAPPSYESLFSS